MRGISWVVGQAWASGYLEYEEGGEEGEGEPPAHHQVAQARQAPHQAHLLGRRPGGNHRV